MKYEKPWLSIDDQITLLERRGLVIENRELIFHLLQTTGYYRLAGYLYPFRKAKDSNKGAIEILDVYKEGTTVELISQLLDFDNKLRGSLLRGIGGIEIALRTQIAYLLGEDSAFAHELPATFNKSFLQVGTGADGRPELSKYNEWLRKAEDRKSQSNEDFVAHFRKKYEDRMPIWALVEILELGQLVHLYSGLINEKATRLAEFFGVTTKAHMKSWIHSMNYVRNVAAHHARLFNRKLVIAPKITNLEQMPTLSHLSDGTAPKPMGVYNTIAIVALLTRNTYPNSDWVHGMKSLLLDFPSSDLIDYRSMGIGRDWLTSSLWE